MKERDDHENRKGRRGKKRRGEQKWRRRERGNGHGAVPIAPRLEKRSEGVDRDSDKRDEDEAKHMRDQNGNRWGRAGLRPDGIKRMSDRPGDCRDERERSGVAEERPTPP